MSTTTQELVGVESDAAAARTDEFQAAPVSEVGPESAHAGDTPAGVTPPSDLRLAIAVGIPVIGAAVMIGGIFLGVSPRAYAAVSGVFGVAVAVGARRARNAWTSNLVAVGGLVVIGVLMVVVSGPGNLADLRKLVSEAAASGDVLRPPVTFAIGWRAILGWLMAVVGFTTGWVAIALRRPVAAVLVPVPFAALVAFSVPKDAQLATGIVLFLSIVVGLRLVTFTASTDEARLPVAYQMRTGLRALPVLGVITLALYFAAQTDFLFPDPVIDPAQEPQKPKTVPLSNVQDRVLFEVTSTISGPWRIGSLDVYDGTDWRLPPFAQAQLTEVPRSGIVDDELSAQVKATFTVAGLEGAVLPGLPNTVGIRARGPVLAYDSRNGNIRLVQGQVEPGLSYDVVAPALASVADLRKESTTVSDDIREFTEIGEAPPAVRGLIAQAPKRSAWDEFDYLRTFILDNVTATGAGAPKSITAERVEDMIAGSREATPFEIVAAQAMLARWIGLPSRIGYGFDGGDLAGGDAATAGGGERGVRGSAPDEKTFEVRPRHGATFVEVYFPGFKWLPVIGVPRKAKATTSDAEQQVNPNVLPSEDIAVQLTLPVLTDPPSVFGKQVQRVLLVVVPPLVFLFLLYITLPALVKARRRARRRAEALADGPKARIAAAYREWRDACTDFACGSATDTPLMFLRRFPPDAEHRELAWLVTRALWGDLAGGCTPELAAAAEELSRALRRRLALAQPVTLRAIAFVSRLSLREPYGADTAADERPSTRSRELVDAGV
jgi:hypothetical protein